jgi:GT2 family glycosyltransferase
MTGDAPAISVVIPTRNRAGLVGEALASIVERPARTSFEVVVIDNASEDDTADVLRRWATRDRRVRVVREEEVGASPALIAGMRAAEGSLLLFTDDDVVAEPGWVDAYAEFFGRRPQASIAGGPILPIPVGNAWPGWFSERAAPSLGIVWHEGERPLAHGEHVWGANMAVRAELFERIGTWRPELGVRGAEHPRDPGSNQDIELQYRARDLGEDVWFCPTARIGHRVDARSPGWCLRRGLVNGRNAYHRPPTADIPQVTRHGGRSLRAASAWAKHLASVPAAAAAFRVRGSRARFERCWVEAWSLGWSMEDLLADDRRDAFDRSVRSITAAASRVAARVAGSG